MCGAVEVGGRTLKRTLRAVRGGLGGPTVSCDVRSGGGRRTHAEAYATGSGGFADVDGAVAGTDDDLDGTTGAVFAFEVGIAGFCSGFVQGGAREVGIDVAGVAVGDDFKAGVGGKTERDFRRRIGELDVVFGGGGIANVNVAVAVVYIHFAAGVFDTDIGGGSAKSEAAGRIDNFKVAGLDGHVAGELSERE